MKIKSATDIKVFLSENLPGYKCEDKSDFMYIITDLDIERISLKLYHHLTTQSSVPAKAGR